MFLPTYFIISSPLMSTVYERKLADYSRYRPRLAVHGTAGEVVDASVTPAIGRGKPNAPVIAIAEKAADILTGNVTAEEGSRAWQS